MRKMVGIFRGVSNLLIIACSNAISTHVLIGRIFCSRGM